MRLYRFDGVETFYQAVIPSFSTNQWFHFVATRNASNTLTLYSNGVAILTTASVTQSYNSVNSQPLSLGRQFDGSGGSASYKYANFRVSNASIYKGKGLTAAEVTQNYNALAGRFGLTPSASASIVTSGMVLNLDAGNPTSYPGTGNVWNDISIKQNNWTPVNLSVNAGVQVPISSSTGALPIYNTTDTYGLVKGTGTRTDSLASNLQLCIPCGAQSGLDLNDLSVTDRSSSLQTVTNNGVVNVTSTSKFYGGTGNFSGAATQWASVPNDGRYNLASRQYTTIEFWYRCDSTGGSKGILATGSYNSTGWEIYVNANGGCDLVVWNCTTAIIDVRTGTATLGVWHHCAFIIDYTAGTTTVTPYLDGVTSGSSSIASAFPNGSANLYIGRRNTWPGGDSGTLYLQDIRVYSTIKYTANFTPSATQNTTVAAGCDSLTDTPTSYGTDTGSGGEVRGNYCTANPLANGGLTFRNGNLDVSGVGNTHLMAYSSFAVNTGKWYFEFTVNQLTDGAVSAGVGNSNTIPMNAQLGSTAATW